MSLQSFLVGVLFGASAVVVAIVVLGLYLASKVLNKTERKYLSLRNVHATWVYWLQNQEPEPNLNVPSSKFTASWNSENRFPDEEASFSSCSDKVEAEVQGSQFLDSTQRSNSVLSEARGKCTLQLGGKLITRKAYFFCLKDRKLFYSLKESSVLEDQTIDLSNCKIRLAAFDFGIEILNPYERIVSSYDYVYLIPRTGAKQRWWYNALCSSLDIPTSAPADSSPASAYKELRRSNSLPHARTRVRKRLSQVFAKVKKNSDSFLGLPTEAGAHETEDVFSSHSNSPQSSAEPPKLERDFPGAVVWLNSLLSRVFQNMRDSSRVRGKIISKVEEKLRRKVELKGYQDLVEDVYVRSLDIGTVCPEFSDISVRRGEDQVLVIDASVSYSARTTSTSSCFSMVLQALVWMNFPSFHFTQVSVTLPCQLSSLEGRIRFECLPYPVDRFSVGFVEQPTLKFRVKAMVGKRAAAEGGKNSLPKPVALAVESNIRKRLKIALLEKLVMPNRKYYPIPGLDRNGQQLQSSSVLHSEPRPRPMQSSHSPPELSPFIHQRKRPGASPLSGSYDKSSWYD